MPVHLTCCSCGSTFVVPPARGQSARYCSNACRPQPIERICLRCGAAFKASSWLVRRGYAKYCSTSCSTSDKRGPTASNWRGGKVAGACLNCGRDFLATQHQLRRGEGKYCSRSCGAAKKTEAVNPSWKGGRYVQKNGYVVITLVGRSRVYEHRQVMEQIIGRPLHAEEDVHHINRIRSDNRPDNLQLIANRSEHTKLHQREDRARRAHHGFNAEKPTTNPAP